MPFARSLAAALVALALPGASPQTIHAEALRGGAKVAIDLSSAMALTIDVTTRGETSQVEWPGELKLHCVATVAEADEQGPTQAKLAFGRVTRREADSLSQPARTKELRACNARYELSRESSSWVAQGERGDLDADEREITTALATMLLGIPPLGEHLEHRTPRSGQRIDLPLDVARKVLPLMDPSIALESMKLIGEGSSKHGALDVLAFGVGASLVTSEGGDMEATIELTGELLLSPANGQVVKMSLSGPVKMSATMEEDGATIEMKGKGTWKFEYSARFE